LAIEALARGLARVALGFTAAAVCGTALLFGLVPAWQGARTGALASLRAETRSTSARSRLRSGLVAAQVALSLGLLTGTGLFLRSFLDAVRVPLRFLPDNVATASIALGGAKGVDLARSHALFDQALVGARQLPGVAAAEW